MEKKYTHRICKVIKNEVISDGILKLSVKGSFKGKPGQFYMLRSWEKEPLLWRPISIHSIGEDHIEFLYQLVGDGTRLLSRLRAGDEVKLIGPLGNGFNLEEAKGRIAVVSGGIGTAPMRYVVEELNKIQGVSIEVFSGFRDKVFGLQEIQSLGIKTNISTEDGSVGHKGYVTECFEPEKYDLVLCCGPEVMMYKVVSMCKAAKTKVYISEEKKMACGIGACLVCTCKTVHGNKRTCKDGPVFNGEDIEI